MLDPGFLAGSVDRLAAAILVIAIGSLLIRDLATGTVALALQSMILTVIAVLVAIDLGTPHAWIAAGLTFVVKVVVTPLVLLRSLERVRLKREVASVVPDRYTLVVGLVLAVSGYVAAGPLAPAGPDAIGHPVPIAIGLMLIGLLAMVVRRKVLSQVLGLLMLENGIYLAALVATGGLPLAVEFAVAFDLLVAVLLMAVMTGWMTIEFDGRIDAELMAKLRERPIRGNR
ncbi:MAG: hypothetical protein EPO26_13200 [Chloroflexota bacterium]|nr:MAG: hypothetical protein EPO26_13200 [Chloroflexota bacterium]